jgi:hypothetical protein
LVLQVPAVGQNNIPVPVTGIFYDPFLGLKITVHHAKPVKENKYLALVFGIRPA